MKKHNKKAEPKRFWENRRHIYAVVAAAAILVIIVALIFRIYFNYPGQPKAAIIDQLSSSQLAEISRHENQTFIQTTETLLSNRFSVIDYYRDNSTVEQYKRLASENYKLIIWRAHSALDVANKFVAISTSQSSGTANYDQYLNDGYLSLCNITGDSNLYFGITPKFVKELMAGRFEDTVIVFMSCNGLKQGYTATAEAFKEKGAKVFISWNGWVDKTENDNSIALFLNYLINENNTISQGVNKIPERSNPDYGPAKLSYTPTSSDVADFVIPDYRRDSIEGSLWLAAFPIRTRARRI
jgi:hypothetical protein